MSAGEDKRILVVGLGNPILSDDGVGPAVLDEVRRWCRRNPARLDGRELVFKEDCHGGIRLMERMVGYRRAIVIDAALTGADPGTVFELAPDDIPSWHSASTHDATLPDALGLGREAGALLPADDAIRVVAVEAADLTTFREACTAPVEAAVGRAARKVIELVCQAPNWCSPTGLLDPTFEGEKV